MEVKWVNLLVVVLIGKISFSKKCECAVIESVNNQSQYFLPVLTLCNITEKVEGYCVPIRNCLTLLLTLNNSEIVKRKCGPNNENNHNPNVCCAKQLVELELKLVTATTTVATVKHQTVQEHDQVIDNQNCGIQNIETRIFGGEPTEKKEFSWLGRLLRRDNQGELIFTCTGALINSKVVLTTAHCLASKEIGELYAVSLGEHETECDPDATECLLNRKTVIVSEYIVHPQYNASSRNHDNDIGLIILRDKVKFTSYIAPICLLENSVKPLEYFVAGWGKTESGLVSGVKLKITLPPYTWKQCEQKYKSIEVQLTPRQICAGGIEGVDSCQGDSGGPLMIRLNDMKWYVAGVVSFGVGCGRKGWPGIYIYVPSYITWIKENMRRKLSRTT